MEKDKEKTVVVFRKFKDGNVIAIFPTQLGDEYHCGSYMHVGQHSDCHPSIVYDTKPAKPEEYADLKAELESIGYNLDIKFKVNKRAYMESRRQQLKDIENANK